MENIIVQLNTAVFSPIQTQKLTELYREKKKDGRKFFLRKELPL